MPNPPAPRPPADVRNVAVVGHSGAGKTTLVEALLVASGAVAQAGDIQDGTTVCDSDPAEQSVGHSVTLAIASLEHRGVKVNLLDTPGSPDFVGELRAGLRAADAVLFVVSAVGGLDAVTVQLWSECEAAGIPRAVVVTQLDRARADFDEAVALCQRLLSEDVLPMHLPMHDDDGSVAGLLSLLDQRLVDHSSGKRVERSAEPEHLALVADLRAELIEALIAQSEDETLLDRYLGDEELDPELLAADLEAAVAGGHFSPALVCAPMAQIGMTELLDVLARGFPSPLEHPCPPVSRPDGSPTAPLTCDPDGPLAAVVVKTTSDRPAGRVSYVRVFSGTLRPDVTVYVSGAGVQRQIGPVVSPLGALLRPVAAAPAGDICALQGLSVARTGDTLSSPDELLQVTPWRLPEPQLPIAVAVSAPADEERFAAGLARLAAEDPTLRLERRPETGQQLLWCMGRGHADVSLQRLRERQGLDVLTPDVVVPFREERTAEGTVLLEPWSEIEVQVPSAFVRTVMSDLAGRRARLSGSEVNAEDEDHSVVRAQVPETALLDYAIALRASSHGTGTFTRRPLGFEPVTR